MNEPHAADRSGSIASAPSDVILASLEKEFDWKCWRDGDQYYARRPQTPRGEHDARGEDPADLREAIMLALRSGHDITPASTPTDASTPPPTPTPRHASHAEEHTTMPAPADPTADTHHERSQQKGSTP